MGEQLHQVVARLASAQAPCRGGAIDNTARIIAETTRISADSATRPHT